jgi:hypothetical protein
VFLPAEKKAVQPVPLSYTQEAVNPLQVYTGVPNRVLLITYRHKKTCTVLSASIHLPLGSIRQDKCKNDLGEMQGVIIKIHSYSFKVLYFLLFFFASPKKNQKKSPTKDYIPFVGGFPDLAFVLL